jgi:hypothetical protein
MGGTNIEVGCGVSEGMDSLATGVERSRFVDINQAACSGLGYIGEELPMVLGASS